MAKILIVHGAGMNMRGKVQTEIFGKMTLPEYDEKIRGYAKELGLDIEIFHSNIEGEVVNKFYAANDAGVRCGNLQSGRIFPRLPGADRIHRAKQVPDDRGAHLQSGAPRPHIRYRAGQSGHGDRVWHYRLLRRTARVEGTARGEMMFHTALGFGVTFQDLAERDGLVRLDQSFLRASGRGGCCAASAPAGGPRRTGCTAGKRLNRR